MLKSSDLILRPVAEAVLSEISLHCPDRLGVEQAERYADSPSAVSNLPKKLPRMAREREEFSPQVRIRRSVSHLVIYQLKG